MTDLNIRHLSEAVCWSDGGRTLSLIWWKNVTEISVIIKLDIILKWRYGASRGAQKKAIRIVISAVQMRGNLKEGLRTVNGFCYLVAAVEIVATYPICNHVTVYFFFFLFNNHFMQFDVHLKCVMSCVYLLRDRKRKWYQHKLWKGREKKNGSFLNAIFLSVNKI